jgi:hypothetical protein
MIDAAEQAEISGRQLTVAKNNLERNRVRKEEVEIENVFADRAKRLQEKEAEEHRRYQEQVEADLRKREKEAASERRQKVFSEWLEYAFRQKPRDAPKDVELDIHEEVLATLTSIDANERDYIVKRFD